MSGGTGLEWVPFASDVNQQLEAARGQRGAEVKFSRGRQKYHIAFDESHMPVQQVNSATGVQRPIRRGVSSKAGRVVLPDGIPEDWRGDEEFQCVDAPEQVERLRALMEASIQQGTTHGMDNLRVHRVERIENKDQWREYSRRAGVLKEQRHGSAAHECLASRDCTGRLANRELADRERVIGEEQEDNELWLWHGTKPETAPILAEWGFDNNVASMGGLYGAGNYFADASSKSHQYRGDYDRVTRMYSNDKNEQGHHCMLLCRVAMGTPFLTERSHSRERRPPNNPKTPGRPFDSIFAETRVAHAGQQQHNEYVVFAKNQVYPEFIIWYTV
eukprot:COSAG04_NODE_155_length_22379_cov_5.613707_1_plen_331_part_00